MKVFQTLFVIIFLLICNLSVSARTYYVNTLHAQSNDSNAGTSSFPWKTISYAVSRGEPGDTIWVESGHYDGFTITTSGTKSNPVFLKGTHRDSVFISEGIEFGKGVHHWVISDFTIHKFDIWGVFIRGENRHLVLDNLTIDGGEAGIRMTWGVEGEPPYDGSVSQIQIRNSLVKNCLYTAIDGSPGPCDTLLFQNLEVTGAGLQSTEWGADGIAVERGSYIHIKDCNIHDNGGDGVDLNSRDTEGYAQGIVVRRNRITGNHRSGIKAWGGGALVNNVLTNHGFTPVVIGMYPGNYFVLHNTIAFNMQDEAYAVRNYAFTAAYPSDETSLSAAIDLTMINNIFAYNSSDAMGGFTGLYLGEGVHFVQEGCNLFYSREDGEIQAEFLNVDVWISRPMIANGEWTQLSGLGEGDLVLEPQFVSDQNLALQPESPAINAGVALDTISTDLYGNPRHVGDKPDIGAIEFQGKQSDIALESALPMPHELWLSNYPNPFNQSTVLEYSIPVNSKVIMKILNIRGNVVYEWPEQIQSQGRYTIQWEGIDQNRVSLASGIYLFLLNLGNEKKLHKILLTR